MNLKFILAIGFFLILFPIVSASDNCSNLYYFIIDHTNNLGEVNYGIADVGNISIDIGLSINETYDYLNNYSNNCNNSFPLPTKLQNFNKGKIVESVGCNLIENKSIFLISMDDYFPEGYDGVVVGNVSCGSINNLKKFFNYVKLSDNNYAINGLKLWWVVLVFLILGVFLLLYVLKIVIDGERLFKNALTKNNKYLN